MSVYIYQPDAFEKLIEVEGEDYRRLGTQERMGHCSFDAFKDVWEAGYTSLKGTDKLRPCLHVKGGSAIYGWWGWNRYAVAAKGEIIFLTGLARTGEDITKATAVGFRLDKEAFKNQT